MCLRRLMCVCRRVWNRAPQAAFVRALIADAHTLFPVFARPYLSLLASATCGTTAAADVLHTLRTLHACTTFFDDDTKVAAVKVRGANVLITDAEHPAMRGIVLKVRSLEVLGAECWQWGRLFKNGPRCTFVCNTHVHDTSEGMHCATAATKCWATQDHETQGLLCHESICPLRALATSTRREAVPS